ncbi:MAG: 1-(5-phosphoribosyl)-5-[(5-phosphoribosylamino)methylideneamino] imidazole-4-carboxamide isomerase [Ignavibacteriales bacterium CG_4_9_14_3_um_filter_34_10]|nr:MAG: 1-(5-phosphoribosyl)-5-[(5-phosphoribosylamino)methylideneamino] imidazole-4-carboxamide isomerase [Ignavibacteriales bacterium CG_4_9_14_3_um_filter_34_10]
MILIIPSIDIKAGKTVRVVQGIPELDCPSYGNDPVEMAMIWRAENARLIHVVDFDCSQLKSHCNFPIIHEICNSVIIPVEFGGGITSLEDAKEILELGVFRIVIGSLALTNPKEFEKIIAEVGSSKVSAAIDFIDHEVVIKGRSTKAGISPLEFAKRLKSFGIERCIVTDVSRNGMLTGANISTSLEIARETGLKVTHSGGIHGYSDLIELNNLSDSGIDSVIIGRALYENKFSCQKIWRVAEHGLFS